MLGQNRAASRPAVLRLIDLVEGIRADYRGTAGRVGRDIGKQLLQPLESGRAEAGQGVDS